MKRELYLQEIRRLFRSHSIIAMLGPRQSGKTTLAKMYSKEQEPFPRVNYFDLESPIDADRLKEPLLALKPLKGLIIIDEIQRAPDLFPVLRFLADDENLDQQYLILGSASRELIKQSAESLAGRIAYLEITPFSLQEVDSQEKLWIRGGFPKSYLAESEEMSSDWREFYIRTFLEQDIPNLGLRIAPHALRRFWMMISHYHGNLLNASELGRAFGASENTMRHYLDILTGTFMVRQLQPWWENITKRQVKSPKIYLRDSGILHSLLGLHTADQLRMSPKIGASWEGFALEELIHYHQIPPHQCYFWSTYSGAELDLLLHLQGKPIGFEIKYSDSPKMTKSMQIALQELHLDHLYIVYPGEIDYSLSEKVTVVGLKNYIQPTTVV